MPYEPPSELAALSLAQIAEAVAQHRIPPLTSWSPATMGDSEMRIARDGRWYHRGGELSRPAMVRAFASLLTRDEDGQHWLLTPHEKLAIEVEDAAFLATDLALRQERGQAVIACRLNTDEFVVAGPERPLRVTGDADTPAIYVAVRHGTEARLNRSTYGQLVEHALERANGAELTVESRGACFSLVPGG